MKSPFPGMNPYLEAFWGDVHTSLVTYARDHLRPQLPEGLRARVEEHVTVRLENGDNGHPRPPHGYYPDVGVVETSAGAPREAAGTAAALAEPLIVPLQLDPRTQRSIRIIDTRSGNRVVTALEFLSPTNKSDPRGRAAYRQKQEELLEGGVNLVEIDLLRGGDYVLAAPAHVVPLAYLAPYRVCVVRASRRHQAEVYRVSLREPLPAIRVPLREADADVRLDLQALVGQSYENGDYGPDIDYRLDPVPPLLGDDASWADVLLREKGLRP